MEAYANKVETAVEINDLESKIRDLLAQTNAILLAHNYQRPEVQQIADLTGDSLGLSIEAAATDARIIVFAGVHFMAESAAILSPSKTVLIPRPDAGCPMADMITREGALDFKRRYPGAPLVTYVNSTADVKAVSDICCTSANAVSVVNSLEARHRSHGAGQEPCTLHRPLCEEDDTLAQRLLSHP